MASTSSLSFPAASRAPRPSRVPPVQQSRWSWHLGTLFGIDVRVHATFFLLVGWVALSSLMHGQGWRMAAVGVAYIVAVFAIIVMHELGHALTARRFGIATLDITLLPIGGISRLERMPSKPSEELLVAIAGPAVNFALALLLLLALVAMGTMGDALHLSLVGGSFLAKLLWTNVALMVFNLIPAFPMDGGRVLRALLAMGHRDYARATDIAARVGQVVAVGFGIVGLLTNPFLVLIALFVWVGAREEARVTHVHASLAGVPVSSAMLTTMMSVRPEEPVASVVQSMLGSFQDDVPVVAGTRFVGMIAREDVLRAAMSGRTDLPVASLMQPDAPRVSETDSLDAAFEQLRASGRRSLPVVRGEHLVGMLPIENVAYVLRMRENARVIGTLPSAGTSPAMRGRSA
jgi:Zn-dependent protease/CBS domain-containing protein